MDGGSGVDYVTVPSMAFSGSPTHPGYPYELAQPPEQTYAADQGEMLIFFFQIIFYLHRKTFLIDNSNCYITLYLINFVGIVMFHLHNNLDSNNN